MTIEGKKVAKGEYLIFTWPGKSSWTISLYSDTSIGGYTDKYKEFNEVAKFTVKPEKLGENIDTFTVAIADLSEDGTKANIQIMWEKTSVKFGIEVPKTW